MKQLVTPNIEINEQAGYCLQYARRVFGAPKVEDSAWEAWENTKYKHRDRNFPEGVSVPVWFDWSGSVLWTDGVWRYGRYGHVAVRHTDGKVYSAPLEGVGRAWFADVDTLANAFGGMTYVGWSGDISGVKVIEEREMVTQAGINYLFRSLLGRDCDSKQAKELMKVHTFDSLEAWIKKLPEYKQRVANAKAGKVDFSDHLPRAYRSHYVPSDIKMTQLKPGAYLVK